MQLKKGSFISRNNLLLAFGCKAKEVNSFPSFVCGSEWWIEILMTLSRSVHAEQSSNRMFHAPFRRVMNFESHERCSLNHLLLPSLSDRELCIVKRGYGQQEKSLFAAKLGISFNFSHRNEFNSAKFIISWNFINAIFHGVTLQRIDSKNSTPNLFRIKLSFLFPHYGVNNYKVHDLFSDLN